MASAFSEIAFTDSVKAAQERYGTRETNKRLELNGRRNQILTENEIRFLAERDSFYLSTISENGWPYSQHRGGPKGFLKVLDERTLGFADFQGNKQYLSVGNLNANNRVFLLLMDYPNRRRLKIWAHAQIVHPLQAPELLARLENPDYPAKVERCVILSVIAFDWNCPQHITQRFSAEEVQQLFTELIEENRILKSRLKLTLAEESGQPEHDAAFAANHGHGQNSADDPLFSSTTGDLT